MRRQIPASGASCYGASRERLVRCRVPVNAMSRIYPDGSARCLRSWGASTALLVAPVLAIPAAEFGGLGEPVSASGFTESIERRAAAVGRFHDHGEPSNFEQLMLELINRSRADPGAEASRLGIDLNEGLDAGSIEDTPKQPLALHPDLIRSARAHSEWMLENDEFSHTGIDGSDSGNRMSAAGYMFAGSWTWGENIAWGGSTGQIDFETHTIALHERLFISPGHRENLANGNFDELGLGVLGGEFDGYNAVMVTQNFARSSATPGPLVLGVVFADADGDGFYDPGEGVAGVRVKPAGNDWHTVTSSSGGYAVPYPAGEGSFELLFSDEAGGAWRRLLVSATGENLKVDLDLALNPLTALSLLPGSLQVSESGTLEMEAAGTPGIEFELQESADLIEWTTVAQFSMEGDGLTAIQYAPDSLGGARFYRVSH